jgi:hypothetical protein
VRGWGSRRRVQGVGGVRAWGSRTRACVCAGALGISG